MSLRATLEKLSPELRAQAEKKLAALPRRTHRHEGAGGEPGPKRKVGLLQRISEPAERLAFHLKAEGIEFLREYVFWPGRKFRSDFAMPQALLLVEVDGGLYINGRHTHADGFEQDAIKRNEATLRGWRVLNFTPAMVASGCAINTIKRALGKTQ